jgi:hypothetical protein
LHKIAQKFLCILSAFSISSLLTGCSSVVRSMTDYLWLGLGAVVVIAGGAAYYLSKSCAKPRRPRSKPQIPVPQSAPVQPASGGKRRVVATQPLQQRPKVEIIKASDREAVEAKSETKTSALTIEAALEKLTAGGFSQGLRAHSLSIPTWPGRALRAAAIWSNKGGIASEGFIVDGHDFSSIQRLFGALSLVFACVFSAVANRWFLPTAPCEGSKKTDLTVGECLIQIDERVGECLIGKSKTGTGFVAHKAGASGSPLHVISPAAFSLSMSLLRCAVVFGLFAYSKEASSKAHETAAEVAAGVKKIKWAIVGCVDDFVSHAHFSNSNFATSGKRNNHQHHTVYVHILGTQD